MRILVFGAGVLGCNIAADLFKAGMDVTLLARGQWYTDHGDVSEAYVKAFVEKVRSARITEDCDK